MSLVLALILSQAQPTIDIWFTHSKVPRMMQQAYDAKLLRCTVNEFDQLVCMQYDYLDRGACNIIQWASPKEFTFERVDAKTWRMDLFEGLRLTGYSRLVIGEAVTIHNYVVVDRQYSQLFSVSTGSTKPSKCAADVYEYYDLE